MSWKYNGDEGFSNHVEKLRDASLSMASIIENHSKLELFYPPESTIVCFRYVSKNISEVAKNNLNKQIRESIFKEGKIIFNYASLNDSIFLRCVILDPAITQKQLIHIIERVVDVGDQLVTY